MTDNDQDFSTRKRTLGDLNRRLVVIALVGFILFLAAVGAILCLGKVDLLAMASSYLNLGTRVVFEPDPSLSVGLVDPLTLEAVAEVLEYRMRAAGYVYSNFSVNPQGQITTRLPAKYTTREFISTLTTIGLLEFVDMSSVLPSEVEKLKTSQAIIQTDYHPDSPPQPHPNQQETITNQVFHTVLSGEYLSDVQVVKDRLGQYQISFQLDPTGSQIFREFTTNHIGQILAILIDKRILSAPSIQNAISDGQGVITGNLSLEEASSLAAQLRSGVLPFPLVQIDNGVEPP